MAMSSVCPQDVKKMLNRQAKDVAVKRRATKHGYQELKDRVWVEPLNAVVERSQRWTTQHVNVARKLIVEGGWKQKRWYDMGLSEGKVCEGQKSTSCTTLLHVKRSTGSKLRGDATVGAER